MSLEAEEYVAALFGLSPAHVHEVVTFYTLYFRAPPGRHVDRGVPQPLLPPGGGPSHCSPISRSASASTVGETIARRACDLARRGVPVRVRACADGPGGRPLRDGPHAGQARSSPRGPAVTAERLLTRNFERPESHTLAVYRESWRLHSPGASAGHGARPPSSRRSRRRICAVSAAPASPPGPSGHSSPRTTRDRCISWSTPTRASRGRSRTAICSSAILTPSSREC